RRFFDADVIAAFGGSVGRADYDPIWFAGLEPDDEPGFMEFVCLSVEVRKQAVALLIVDKHHGDQSAFRVEFYVERQAGIVLYLELVNAVIAVALEFRRSGIAGF